MNKLVEAPIKLALRVEGHYWVAYIARRHGMEGGHEIGRIALRAAQENPAVHQGFMDLMKLVMTDALKAIGVEASFPTPPQPAPESERSGRA